MMGMGSREMLPLHSRDEKHIDLDSGYQLFSIDINFS